MPNLPFVTVVVPVFNDQAGVDACLSALAAQAYPRDCFEVIVIDNGSRPPVRLEGHVGIQAMSVVCAKPGAYAARNAGIALARGEIIALTDADCRPERDWLAEGVAALQRGEGACIVGGEVLLALSERPTATELYQWAVGFLQRENIEARGFTATANLFCLRGTAERIGPFDENLLSGGDREWSWRGADRGFKICFAPHAIVTTTARRSLLSAIRQTRRVAGGRLSLRKMEAAHVSAAGVRPHRGLWVAATWILSNAELRRRDRLRVFAVAVLLKAVTWLETARLRFGSRPERR